MIEDPVSMPSIDSSMPGGFEPESASDNSVAHDIHVPQGWKVFAVGLFGSLMGIAPISLLFISRHELRPVWTVLAILLWASVAGGLVTYYWSTALHDRVAALRRQLDAAGLLTPDERDRHPWRLEWMPAWLGIFERMLYCFLIGLNVAGGAAFVGAWVVLKMAGGWQSWSKGSMHGQALFIAGLLGNAMSVLFGVVAGIVLRSYLCELPIVAISPCF